MNIEASRRERKKEAIRSKIIVTAIDLFSKNGIDAVTVDEIAESADIGKGTIYNYFDTREDIIVAFIAQIEQEVQSKLRTFSSSKRRLDAILTEFIRLQFRLKEPHYRFIRVFFGQMFFRTEQFLPYLVQMQQAVDPPIEQLFRTLQAQALMRTDFRFEDLVMSFKTTVMGLSALWAVEGPPFRATNRLVQQQMKMFSDGIKAIS